MALNGGLQRAFGRLPRALLGLLIAFIILSGAVSVLNPPFESTDEIRHYRYIRHLVVDHTLPIQGDNPRLAQGHHPPLYYALGALVSGWVNSPHTPAYAHPLNPFWGYRPWEVGVDNKLQYLHNPGERFPFREGYLAAMLPRWLNVVVGAITVGLTYGLGRRVAPQHPGIALAAAAMVAFNPQFIYLSGAINNDIIATATAVAVLLLGVSIVQDGVKRPQVLVALGVAYGLALLAKLHVAVMGGVIMLSLWLATGREIPHRTVLYPHVRNDKKRGAWRGRVWRWALWMGVVLGIACLIAGWWFARNWVLYGDPTGMKKLNEMWAGRSAKGSWWAVEQGLPYLWSSLWGRFGYGQIPLPQPIYIAVFAFCCIGLIGAAVVGLLPYKAGRKRDARDDGDREHCSIKQCFMLLILTVCLYVSVVLYYMLIQPAGPMGRFLFPALPPFALLVVVGWYRGLGEAPTVALAIVGGMGALALVAIGGYLRPAVGYPPRASRASAPEMGAWREDKEAGAWQLGDVARVLATEVRPSVVHPGELVYVTVVWEPLRRTDRPYNVYVHLIDEAGVLIAQRDSWPGLSRAPTTAWRVGYPFVDVYRVELLSTAYTPNEARVRVGLYEPEYGRLPVYRQGQASGDGIEVGTVAVPPGDGQWPNAQYTNFSDEIALVGYTVAPRKLSPGETFTLTLYWQPLEPRYPYGVFAQVLDAAYKVWGSMDSGGPAWDVGGVITETRHIMLLPDTPQGSYPIQVGLQHSEIGRLPVVTQDGQYIDNRVLLGPIQVQE